MKSPSNDGMTLGAFKSELRSYGRSCIPENIRHLIQITKNESNYLFLGNTEEAKGLIKRKFGTDSISTQIASNYDIKSIQKIRAFGYKLSENSRLISELFPDENENQFLEEEKNRLKQNIEAVLKAKNTRVYQLIEAWENESDWQDWDDRTRAIDNDILRQLKTNDNGEERSFFAVGYIGNEESRLDKFIVENRWENGDGDIAAKAVNSAKLGDVLFVKTTWEKDKTQRIFTIKAIGVVYQNLNDGHHLRVTWYKFPKKIDLTLGRHYRSIFYSLHSGDLDDILSEVLRQEPDLLKRVKDLGSRNTSSDSFNEEHTETPRLDISSNFDSESKTWWVNDKKGFINTVNLELGREYSFELLKTVWFNIRIGDLLVLYDMRRSKEIKGVFEMGIFKPDRSLQIILVHVFKRKTSINDLEKLDVLKKSDVLKKRRSFFVELEDDEFEAILGETELKGFSLKDYLIQNSTSKIAHK